MNENNFTMELSARAVLMRWLENVVIIMAVVIAIPIITGRPNMHFEVLASVMLFVVLTIWSFVSSTQWSAKVTEDKINLKTITGKRTIDFSKIASVRWNWDRKKLMISSKSSSEPEISIFKSSNNYDKLIARLQELNIEGLDKIDK